MIDNHRFTTIHNRVSSVNRNNLGRLIWLQEVLLTFHPLDICDPSLQNRALVADENKLIYSLFERAFCQLKDDTSNV